MRNIYIVSLLLLLLVMPDVAKGQDESDRWVFDTNLWQIESNRNFYYVASEDAYNQFYLQQNTEKIKLGTGFVDRQTLTGTHSSGMPVTLTIYVVNNDPTTAIRLYSGLLQGYESNRLESLPTHFGYWQFLIAEMTTHESVLWAKTTPIVKSYRAGCEDTVCTRHTFLLYGDTVIKIETDDLSTELYGTLRDVGRLLIYMLMEKQFDYELKLPIVRN